MMKMKYRVVVMVVVMSGLCSYFVSFLVSVGGSVE